MQIPELTSLINISREMAEIYAQAFKDPVKDLHKLYEMAKRDQWNVSELPWDSIGYADVPDHLRQSLANMYTQTHYGELGALMCTAKAVEKAPMLMAKMFGGTQVMDE